jgi:flagellar biosynthesis protein FliQ
MNIMNMLTSALLAYLLATGVAERNISFIPPIVVVVLIIIVNSA